MEFMNNWENVFNEIKHELAEQERIVNLIQSTKMYHAVEGIHNIRKKVICLSREASK